MLTEFNMHLKVTH